MFHLPTGTFSERSPAKTHPLLLAKKKKLQSHLVDAELICCLASPQISVPIHSIKLRASSLHSEPGDVTSMETALFFAHYLSLIESNFLPDNAHNKKYLRMAVKVCPFTLCQKIPDLLPKRNYKRAVSGPLRLQLYVQFNK